ncbi:MAG: hypothetical protein N7Q72_06315, partial [Spiroplasma sp. Tabriz.8]|nr:hypothetical protein [Spiroplasma sp. Tabriz.8]
TYNHVSLDFVLIITRINHRKHIYTHIYACFFFFFFFFYIIIYFYLFIWKPCHQKTSSLSFQHQIQWLNVLHW